jgi:hypothetical protein
MMKTLAWMGVVAVYVFLRSFLSSVWPPRRMLGVEVLPVILALAVTMTSFPTITAQGEWYVGAYGGLAKSGAFSNVILSDRILEAG